MTRIDRKRKRKMFRRKVVYPIFFMLIMMISFVFLVDYRMNSAMGRTKITIVRFERRNNTEIVFKAFDREVADIDTVYLKRDINRLKNEALAFIEKTAGDAVEVIKQYDFKNDN